MSADDASSSPTTTGPRLGQVDPATGVAAGPVARAYRHLVLGVAAAAALLPILYMVAISTGASR